jgi:methylmalonyl-CoA/ethylmalonyl-CoA epimerase
MMFTNLDHLAVVVEHTEDALRVFRDQLKLPFLFSEVMDEQGVRLTHLDLGNCHLQLIEPLWDEHPLRKEINPGSFCLHHICLMVKSIPDTLQDLMASGITSRDAVPRRGPNQRKAVFLEPNQTGDILIEITSE